MTGLEFLSATIGQLIWPIFILISIVLLREPIKQLASNPRLKRVKAGPGGLELELKDELDQAEKKLEAAPTPKAIEGARDADDAALDFIEEMRRLAQVSPRSVVMESHTRLEGLLRDTLELSPEDRRRYSSMRALVREAVQQGVLTEPESGVVTELTYLRNRVAHEPLEDITRDSALRYAELTADVAMAVRIQRGETSLDGPIL